MHGDGGPGPAPKPKAKAKPTELTQAQRLLSLRLLWEPFSSGPTRSLSTYKTSAAIHVSSPFPDLPHKIRQ
eukprot:1048850-Amphidinium_carterae.5